jgi:hypothetical protein
MFSYTTASQTTYVFVTSVVTATQAEKVCTDIGGHLATYPSLADQAEAEQVGACCKAASVLAGRQLWEFRPARAVAGCMLTRRCGANALRRSRGQRKPSSC